MAKQRIPQELADSWLAARHDRFQVEKGSHLKRGFLSNETQNELTQQAGEERD